MNAILKTTVLAAVVVSGLASAVCAQTSRGRETAPADDAVGYNALLTPQLPYEGRSVQVRPDASFPNETDETGFARGSENPQMGD